MRKRNRDGALESIWQQSASSNLQVNTLDTNRIYDAVVIGGGITGVTTAFLLQKSGKQVVLIDAANIGFGTTGGTTAHLSTILDATYDEIIKDFNEEKAHLVAEVLREAIKFISDTSKSQTSETSFSALPAYYLARNDEEEKMLDDIVTSAKKVGMSMDYVSESEYRMNATKVAKIENQGQFNPIAYILSLASSFQQLGGIVIEGCRATGLEEGDEIKVNTSVSSIRCRNVIYATHIPPGVNILHFRNAPYRSYVLAAKLKDGNYPKALAYDLEDPYHYYRSQEINGETYLIVGGEDHKTGHEDDTLMRFAALEEHVRQYFDVREISFRWSSQFFVPTDGLPYIGMLPGAGKNVYVATGFNGDGMMLGTVSAFVISDLINTGKSRYGELFSPSRVKPVAGFENFVKEAADVVGNLIGGRFSAKQIDSAAEMKNGDAKVVKLDGQVLALYKDEKGELHSLSSACTHIKCTVGWNNAEKTWDCPCHGSRFTYDGVMINAPARKDLEKIKTED